MNEIVREIIFLMRELPMADQISVCQLIMALSPRRPAGDGSDLEPAFDYPQKEEEVPQPLPKR